MNSTLSFLACFAMAIFLAPSLGRASEKAGSDEVKNGDEIKIYKRLIPADVLRGE